jgi:hypothetical protein
MATLRRQMRWGDGIQNGGDHRPRDDKRRTVLGIAALVRGTKVKPTAPCCVLVRIIRSIVFISTTRVKHLRLHTEGRRTRTTWSQATRQNILSATILLRQSITSEPRSVLIHCFVALTKILSIFWLLYCLLLDHQHFIFNIFDIMFYRVVSLFFCFLFSSGFETKPPKTK